ncbi:MAG: hypothetical protein PHS14_15025 [Elusimicrobia bacterium]|nr:hypothetical protein [Elusimicrobiota bacterium]
MDPKPQMPDIKAEVNKVDDGKKKATGLLGGLFGGGGSGAAGGLGGLGAGAVSGGGLLATKAGMLALVLMGSAVAGGIGLAGYKMFGPGDADKTGGNLSLFAPRTQPVVDPNAVAPVNADGSSASLNFAAAAAAKDKEAEAAASASAQAPADNTAGDPAKDAAAADAARRAAEAKTASGGAINSGGGAGAAGSMGHGLANVKKLGALSGAAGGGATTSASAGSTRLGDNLANAAKNGASSGFSRGGPGAKASSARGVAARGGRGARAQARNVMGDQANGRAGSSFAAGRTYDGSTAGGGGAIGPDGGAIGMAGAGDGASAQPKSIAANSAPQTNTQVPLEPPAKHMVTPWEQALNKSLMLVALAGALMMAASALLKDVTLAKAWTVTLAKVLLGIAIAASAMALFFAGQATFGPGGQKTQGGLIMAAAACAGGLAAYLMTQIWSADVSTDAKCSTLSTAVKGSETLIMVIGGAGAVALIGAMMVPKHKVSEEEAKANGYPTSYYAPAPQQNYRV